MWGRKVAAHAHGAEAIKRAVRAGVASIEHGSLIDDEGIRLMKEHGTYLVADIYNDAFAPGEHNAWNLALRCPVARPSQASLTFLIDREPEG